MQCKCSAPDLAEAIQDFLLDRKIAGCTTATLDAYKYQLKRIFRRPENDAAVAGEIHAAARNQLNRDAGTDGAHDQRTPAAQRQWEYWCRKLAYVPGGLF
jgi:hypothetical protein